MNLGGRRAGIHDLSGDAEGALRHPAFENGEAVFGAIGVSREDWEGRMRQTARNFEFFGAPVALFFAIDRDMEHGQWADLGMFLQSVMLSAREQGLYTAALESWGLLARHGS